MEKLFVFSYSNLPTYLVGKIDAVLKLGIRSLHEATETLVVSEFVRGTYSRDSTISTATWFNNGFPHPGERWRGTK